MYFPYLRGRQFELLAIRELIEHNCISNNIIPIIEPVRASSTLLKTIIQCKEANQHIAFIINPHVGSFSKEFREFEKSNELLTAIKDSTIKACVVDQTINDQVNRLTKTFNSSIEDSLFVFDKKDYIESYLLAINNSHAKFNLIPDERDFRRSIRDNRVLLSDAFDSKDRNSDYSDAPELYSRDQIYYKEDGYIGFADYSIVGNRFSEAGFAPYCLVIHIVYFDEKKQLLIRHFKSSSNEDATDPANKFREALQKLRLWNEKQKLDTYAMRQFKKMYDDGSYPGLGTIKKLSLMHHIELVNKFLNEPL